MSDSIVISGFGREDVNGVYAYDGIRNGYASYVNSLGYLILYVDNRMPYSNDAGYIVLVKSEIQGAIPIELYPYIKVEDVVNVTTDGWTTTLPITSGETEVDVPFIESSSSQSPSSESSSKSSSSSSSSSTLQRPSSSSSSLSTNSSSFSSSSSTSSSSETTQTSQSTNSSSHSSASLASQSSASSMANSSSSSTSSSSIDSSSTSSADALLRVSNSGTAYINGDYTYSGTNQNGKRVFDLYNQYYFTFDGSLWILTDDFTGTIIAKWPSSLNGYPDGINNYYNPIDYPLASGIYVTQINVSEFSQSSRSTNSSSSSS